MARAIIEALIFSSSEPISCKTMADIIGINEHTVKQMLSDLSEERLRNKSGLNIIEVANGYQFVTHPECAPYI